MAPQNCLLTELVYIHVVLPFKFSFSFFLFFAAYFHEIDQGTVSSSNCLTVNINQDCLEDITTGAFSIQLRYAFGNCRELLLSAYTTLTTTLSAHSTCVPVGSGTGEFCYDATFMYQDTVIDTEDNLNFASCYIAGPQSFLGPGVSYQLDGVESGGNVSHLTTATFTCSGSFVSLIGSSQSVCVDGQWSTAEARACQQSCSGLLNSYFRYLRN